MAYNDIMEAIQDNGENNILWEFKKIKAHQGPLNSNHPDYRGSNYNVTVEWENGETADEPLGIMAVDAPLACAKYGHKNNLLGENGWKRLQTVSKKMNKMLQSVHKVKLRSV